MSVRTINIKKGKKQADKDFKTFIKSKNEIALTWNIEHNTMCMNNIKEMKKMMKIWNCLLYTSPSPRD